MDSPTGKQWQRIGVRPHHGIVLPLFSLRSQESCGIGEFFDLIPLIPWCKEVGFDVIQLLPLNDPGLETSPYSALSAFALNPLYLSLWALPYIEDIPYLQQMLKEIRRLNESQRIDYPKVYTLKEGFLLHYFRTVGNKIAQTDEFKEFRENNPWVEDYALFKTLKIIHHWHHWKDWSPECRSLQTGPHRKDLEVEIRYHTLIQYLAFKQLKEIKALANAQGIYLMGDIPILLNEDSADVWKEPNFFNREWTAGAPPDMYAEDGQNWGFPLYNWDNLEKQNYNWWKERLKVAGQIYDIYRIDHIVGFYRIWAIPHGHPGKEGKFIPEDSSKWIPQGEKILTAMTESNSMLPIGEDLGNVPPEVRDSMGRLGICGTKVMRWERAWNEDKRFINPKDYTQESLTTVSTHDSEPLSLWWQNYPEDAKTYAGSKGWDYSPQITVDQLFAILYDSHHSDSLFHINPLQEYLALVPGMTWPSKEDERVNTPGTVSPFNWTYRFKPSVEEIVSSQALKDVIKRLL